MVSKHYKDKRYEREILIKKYLNGDGKVIRSFIVDRMHPKGAEIHSVTDNGVIIIRNLRSGKIVTKLIARPQQIKKLYNSVNKEAPAWLLDMCYIHQCLNYNK